MKAALEAAAIIEERVDGFEIRVNCIQESIDALQKDCATKIQVEAVEQRTRDAHQHLGEALKQKADLEQVNQCVKAIRHEVMEVVKRKANSELLESELQEIRQQLSEVSGLKAVIEEVGQQTQQQVQAVRSEFSKMVQEHIDAITQNISDRVQVVCGEFNEKVHDLSQNSRSEISRVEQHVHMVQKEIAVDLDSKAEQLAALRQTVDAQVKAVQQRLSELLDANMDKQQVQTQIQQVLETVGAKAGREQLEDLDQRLIQVSVAKADKEMLDSYVAHAQDIENRLANIERSKVSKDTVDACVLSVQSLESSVAQIISSKVDAAKVIELVEAVRDEVSETVHRTRNMGEQVEHKLNLLETFDLNNLDRRTNDKIKQQLQSIRQEIVDLAATNAAECVAVAKEDLIRLVNRKVDAEHINQLISRVETIESQTTTRIRTAAPTSAAENDGGDSGAAHPAWVESLMEQRMRLVKTELTKLVDKKADTEHMQNCIEAATQEIAQHVDRRVDAAQQKLSEQVGQLAQQVDQRILRVEKQVHGVLPATQGVPEASPIEFNFDDSRTARVRQLLTQLSTA